MRERAGSGRTAETDPSHREPNVARDSDAVHVIEARLCCPEDAHGHPSVESTARAIRAAVGEQDATGVAAGYRLGERWVRVRLTDLEGRGFRRRRVHGGAHGSLY